MKRLALLLALMVAQPLLADSNLPPAYWANRQLPNAQQEAKAQALMDNRSPIPMPSWPATCATSSDGASPPERSRLPSALG
jgi:hypothetical protein